MSNYQYSIAYVYPVNKGEHGYKDGYWFKTPYNAHFVEELKMTLEPKCRHWRPDLKMWWVDEYWIRTAVGIAERHYDTVHFRKRAKQNSKKQQSRTKQESGYRRRTTTNNKNAWEQLWLHPGAPQEVIKAAYRAMARLNHPDLGGDNEIMQQINAAYERLKKD